MLGDYCAVGRPRSPKSWSVIPVGQSPKPYSGPKARPHPPEGRKLPPMLLQIKVEEVIKLLCPKGKRSTDRFDSAHCPKRKGTAQNASAGCPKRKIMSKTATPSLRS